MRVRLRLPLRCNADIAADAFASYLRQRHARVSNPAPRTISAVMPFVFVGTDRRLYSRANWVGLNPVAQASSIQAQSIDATSGSTLNVTVTSQRIYLFPLVLFFVAAVAASDHAPAGALAIVAVILVVYASIEWWLFTRGISHEFLAYLDARL